MNNKYWYGAFFVFLIDLITKIYALNLIEEDEFIISKLFSIQRIWNESYIMANISFDIPVILFRASYVFFALILAASIYWVTQQKELNEKNYKIDFAKTGLFIIMGGIWGNCFDRIFRSEGVVDFIRINFLQTIPIFNIADVFIYVGILCIIIAWCLIITEKIAEIFLNKQFNF